jgi:polysaccharide biosynthesis transport protein
MRDLIAGLRDRYDQVIVDSPPLLLVSDPKRISALVDTTLLLVRWQETPADKAMNALRELDGVGAAVAGAVLCQVDLKRQAQYGYAGVGSYYGKYQRYYVN